VTGANFRMSKATLTTSTRGKMTTVDSQRMVAFKDACGLFLISHFLLLIWVIMINNQDW